MKTLLKICLFFAIGISFDAVGQNKDFDRLEMLYAQGHYKIVYRKANQLLDKPDYDNSMIPSFYKAMALIQLCQNDLYFTKNPGQLLAAKQLLVDVKNGADGTKIFEAHIYEIAALKRDVSLWIEDLKRSENAKKVADIQSILKGLFDKIPDIENERDLKPTEYVTDIDLSESKEIQVLRQDLISIAKKQIGVPYVWAGNDPSGFDCSGFTSYVLKSQNKEIPRRAIEQYEASNKIKQKNVQPGDLVFFDSGSGINHVGMIISGKGEPLVMIHASSSKGITITEIEKTDYWLKRLYGFGTFVH